MPTRTTDACITKLRTYTRTKYMHVVFVNLGVDHSDDRWKKCADCLVELERIAVSHPNLLSLEELLG